MNQFVFVFPGAVDKIIFRGQQKWSPIASLTNRDEIFRDFQLNFTIVQGTMLRDAPLEM